MAEEAGKILELLSIEHVAESYRIIHEMQPIELLRRLESENISTRGHMPELRARLLRFQVRKCHPYVHVPWYPEDEVAREKEESEEDDDDEEVQIIEEQSQIGSLMERLDVLQKELDELKMRDAEKRGAREKQDDASEDGDSTQDEDDNTPTNSDGENSDTEAQNDFEPVDSSRVLGDPAMAETEAKKVIEDNCVGKTFDVAENVEKPEYSKKSEWVQQESEKFYQNQTSYNIPPLQPPSNKKPLLRPYMWPEIKLGQNYNYYSGSNPYQYYSIPDTSSMMNQQSRNYYTDFQQYQNQWAMSGNAKPYWL